MGTALQYRDVTLPMQKQKIEYFANWVLDRCDCGSYNLTILFVDDPEMCWFNEHYRQKQGATNVLSFPFAEGADENISSLPIQELGDIVISVDTANREALEYNQSLEERLRWLIVHGILHLLGYDHERGKKDAQEMETKELELLNEYVFHRRIRMTQLAINVDHVATIRQARGITEPDPVVAAALCEMAGASGIVIHLREDRRHIQDRDVRLIRETIKTKLNLEMGANKEIIKIALEILPDMVTLVPEKREELTTEGGLDIVANKKKLARTIEKMSAKNIPVSLFIDPIEEQITAAKEIGAQFVELHTGRYCDALGESTREKEYQLIVSAAEEAARLGLRVNAGHGLDYHNTAAIAAIDAIEELSIGHAIIARAVFCGIEKAVQDMLKIIQQANCYK